MAVRAMALREERNSLVVFVNSRYMYSVLYT